MELLSLAQLILEQAKILSKQMTQATSKITVHEQPVALGLLILWHK